MWRMNLRPVHGGGSWPRRRSVSSVPTLRVRCRHRRRALEQATLLSSMYPSVPRMPRRACATRSSRLTCWCASLRVVVLLFYLCAHDAPPFALRSKDYFRDPDAANCASIRVFSNAGRVLGDAIPGAIDAGAAANIAITSLDISALGRYAASTSGTPGGRALAGRAVNSATCCLLSTPEGSSLVGAMGSGGQLSREFTSYYKRFALERHTTVPPDEPSWSDDAPDADSAEPPLDEECEVAEEVAGAVAGVMLAATAAESRLYRAVAAHAQVRTACA